MATIHTGTTMAPTKLELLTDWLPRQSWYRDAGRAPELARAGGFRLDDPAGEVGIEFAFVTDGRDTTYHVPMTYRSAPLTGAEDGLIGTSEHGVLGRRWIYDAAYDPVAVATLLDFVSGAAQAQHQSQSDTLDPSVGRRWAGADRPVVPAPPQVSESEPGRTTVALTGHVVLIVRVLEAGFADAGALGAVEADWIRPDGGTARGAVVLVR
jgi:hypothetical protein